MGRSTTVNTQLVTVQDMVSWLSDFHGTVIAQQAYLTDLDSVIGDADHGTNLVRGMNAVMAKLDEETPSTFAELFKMVGMTLVTSVGGSSGPLYGTFFLRLGMSAGAVETLDAAAFGRGLREGLDGIVARGKPEPGDKTMFDAMAPGIAAWESTIEAGGDLLAAMHAARIATEDGRDATLPLVARKGRASYLGERSTGHIDPGAASTALLFGALEAALLRAGGR